MGQTTGLVTAALQLGLEAILVRPKRQFAEFVAQVTFEENHSDDLEITDHPIELGARITDHAYMRPAVVIIRCGWSNTPSNGNILSGLLSAVTGTINGIGDIATSFLNGEAVSQVNEVYKNLLALQASRVPFDVYTGKRIYRNMLVKSLRVETTKETENSLMVTASFQEVILVSTTTVTQVPSEAQKDPATTAPVTNQGTQSVSEAPTFNSEAGEAAMSA